MKKIFTTVLITILVIGIIFVPLFFAATPTGRTIWNNWFHAVQKSDDRTNYETLKKVEDTCRAMIASYNADKLTYEQYKDSNSSEKLEWAEQAKMRANRTASTYNNYILKNNYVWTDGIPNDIYAVLDYIN